MPKPNGRSLDDQTCLDIVTYILYFNGVPAGAGKLQPNADTLNQIVISIPASAPGEADAGGSIALPPLSNKGRQHLPP